jgi:hypothetical protein
MFDLHHRVGSFKQDREMDTSPTTENDTCSVDSSFSEVSRDTSEPAIEFSFPTLNSASSITTSTSRDDELGSTEDDFTLVGDDSSVVEKCSDDEGHANGKLDYASQRGGARSWETTWYARWEMLIELVKREGSLRQPVNWREMCPNIDAQGSVRLPLEGTKRPPMFYFAGDDEEFDEVEIDI